MDIIVSLNGLTVAPFVIGMPFDEALVLARSFDGYIPPRPGIVRQPGVSHYSSGLGISLGADRQGRIQAIEFYRPEEGVRLLYEGTSLFELSADDVVARLIEKVEVWENSDERLAFYADEKVVVLWRPFRSSSAEDDPQGWYFQSAVVAVRNYYN